MNVDAVRRWRLHCCAVLHGGDFREKLEGVDGNLRLPRVQLQGRCHEALWKEEAGNPVAQRRPFDQPLHQEADAGNEVYHPGVQRLQAGICNLSPIAWDLLLLEGVEHSLQLRRHEHRTFDGLAQHDQAGLDHLDELLDAGIFLAVEDTNGDDPALRSLFVGFGVGHLALHRVWNSLQELLRHIRNNFFWLLATATRGNAGLNADNCIQELLGLVELGCDERIWVQPENAGVLIHRQ
mmetsp:Transcript_62943/g.150374  ORF Transcript_62943/g.150374 Transcript_62943/m.150374 type:complete len:237 (-) Transcript_62943:1847-2557(-)